MHGSPAPSPDLFRHQALSWLALGERGHVPAATVVDAGLAHFGSEVTLLGLGLDVALADGQAERAQTLFNAAPQGLVKLPDWAERGELLDCVQSSGPCRERARARLDEIANTFASDSKALK